MRNKIVPQPPDYPVESGAVSVQHGQHGHDSVHRAL